MTLDGGFDYRLPDGEPVANIDTLMRIRSLVIPPAWTEVWTCPYANGHIQANGRDKRGRKQYRYHPRWREVRAESKYGKMLIFGRVLPVIRERVGADLRRHGLSRERVLAAVVRLMEVTLFRIGNSEYAKANKSYGLTTLRDRHVEIDGSWIHLSFRGKHHTPRNRYHRSAAGSHHQRLPRPARLRAVPIRRRGRQPGVLSIPRTSTITCER
jgi:DNA topoisomerase-1